ncbi:transposase [Bacteroidota bacterium]
MSIRRIHDEKGIAYFITITCYEWIPLIELSNLYDCIYSWFARLNKENELLLGYVIMPNHLHLLIYHQDPIRPSNKIIGEGKRFLSYEIIKRLKNNEGSTLLTRILSDFISNREKQKGQKHKVWFDSFDAKPCYSRRVIEQKLDYIHENPVLGSWNLVKDFAKFQYSSAAYYELGNHDPYLTHYMDFYG